MAESRGGTVAYSKQSAVEHVEQRRQSSRGGGGAAESGCWGAHL
jgi:hypothetical protein